MKSKLIKYIAIPGIALILMFTVLIVIGVMATAVAGNQAERATADYTTLSEEVEFYRNTVEKLAEKHGIKNYTDILLCIMQVSTAGRGTDVMNAGEFAFNTQYPKQRGMITDPEYSIECGIQEFKELLSLVGVESETDSEKLLIVYQAYHIDRGYIDFANGTYSAGNAKSYCDTNNLGEHFNYSFAEQVSFYLQAFGNGVSAAGFIYPLKDFHNISSPYGYRYSPTTGKYELHSGTDFPAPKGTPVLASMDGIVQKAGWLGGYGNCVVLKHNAQFVTYYAHNTSLVVKVGDQVKQGQIIAYVGSTGNSTGPHCHFEIRVSGKTADPMSYLKK